MGQYHMVVNLDRGEYLFPHHLGDGLKLLEFGCGGGTMTALAVLLAVDNGRGLGDLHAVTPDTSVENWETGFTKSAEGWTSGGGALFRERTIYARHIGAWASQRIVIAGDYGDPYLTEPCNLYEFAKHNFRDISFEMVELLCADPYLRETLQKDDWFQRVLEEHDLEQIAASARRPTRNAG
jgi:hypothetical protein